MGLVVVVAAIAVGPDALPERLVVASIALCVFAAHTLAGYYWGERPWKQLLKRLIDNEFLLCVNCGYILRNASSSRICPECGVQYDASQTERVWREWAAKQA